MTFTDEKGTKTMLKVNQYNCDLFSKRYLDCMLPRSHVLLDIKKLVNFSFVTDEVKDLYSDSGRGSIDPTRMFKMLFLMFFYNIPSERELVEQVQVNVLYRYFCDINLDESIPDHSTFTVFRQRLGKQRFKRLFNRVLEQCIEYDLVYGSHISFDATIVRADAAMPNNKRTKENLLADADKIIEKTFNDIPTQKTSRGNRELSLSKSDPDARWTKRPGEGAILGYNAHIATDSKEKIITNIDVTPANIPGHDKMIPLIDEQVDNHKFKIDEVSADSEYGAGHIREALEKRSINAYIPLRNRGMKGGTTMFKYEDFKYDKERDIVACPAGKAMHFMRQVPDARVYRSYKRDCKNCSFIDKCVTSKLAYRTIEISNYYDIIKRAELRNKTERYKEAAKIRILATEPKFAEAKRYHGLNRFRYRGIIQVSIQAILTAICINIKRLAKVVMAWLRTPVFEEALAYR
jgi:transposase